MSFDESADQNTQRLADADLLADEEQLYLSDSGGDGDGTEIFTVELVEGSPNRANLTSVAILPSGNFDQVDALAASPDGLKLLAVDKESAHLGVYDVESGSFTDMGAVSGISSADEIVLATVSPAGELIVAGQSNGDRIYRVDWTSGSPGSATATEFAAARGAVDMQGADLAYVSDGTLFVYTNSGGGDLFTVELSTGATTEITPTPVPGGITGMAVRDAGDGDFVFSAGDAAGTNESKIFTVPQSGGDETEFQMFLGGSEYDYTFGDMTVGRLSSEGCTSTQGYWKTHTDVWIEDTGQDPDQLFFKDNDFFGDGSSWSDVLDKPVRGDADINLAHQFIAAYLNAASGTFVPSDVQEALDRAEEWFSGSGSPYASEQEKLDDAELLASYNEGNEGVPSCDVALATCPYVTSSSGDVTVSSDPLSDVTAGGSTAEKAQAFAEFAGYDHGGFPLNVHSDNTTDTDEQNDVSDGTPLCSYYVHFDDGNTSDRDRADGSLTFGSEVKGLIVAGTYNPDDIFYQQDVNTMCDVDGALGHSATIYPDADICGIGGGSASTSDARGLEVLTEDPTLGPADGNQDQLEISGNTVDFNIEISNKHDSFRIILEPVEDGIVP